MIPLAIGSVLTVCAILCSPDTEHPRRLAGILIGFTVLVGLVSLMPPGYYVGIIASLAVMAAIGRRK